MKLIGMMTVRDEDDIVVECLEHACKFHDVVFVADCGSTDQSSNIIQSIASQSSKIIFLGELGPKHPRQVKHHIWARFRREFSWDSWWSVVDADEFLETDPRSIIQSAESEFADHIFAKIANFYFTEDELKDWLDGHETLDDRKRSIQERRLNYRMHTSQIRMFRNLPWLRWNEDIHHPKFLAKPARERLIYRHYQYRDPLQIEKRIKIRLEWTNDSIVMSETPHWKKFGWEEAISPTDDPYLKRAVLGKALEPDPKLPSPNKKQSYLKTLAKYGYAFLTAAKVQQKTQLFENVNFPKE